MERDERGVEGDGDGLTILRGVVGVLRWCCGGVEGELRGVMNCVEERGVRGERGRKSVIMNA